MEKLQVPENITLRPEVWRGVGRAELVAILAVTFVALLAAVTFCFISPMDMDKLIAAFMVILAFSFGCGLFSKLDNNQSIYDFLRRQARFRKEQQIFHWQRGKETEVYLLANEKSE